MYFSIFLFSFNLIALYTELFYKRPYMYTHAYICVYIYIYIYIYSKYTIYIYIYDILIIYILYIERDVDIYNDIHDDIFNI